MANGVTNKDLYEAIKDSNDDIKKELKNYVRREEFEPIKRGYYGVVALITASIVGAVMAIILRLPK